MCLLEFHFVSSILIDMDEISAGSTRTVVSKISEYSSHRALNFRCRLGGPFILIKSIIDEPVVASCGLYSNGVTSQHALYYCTYYSVSLTCTVHSVHHMFSHFPMLTFHLQHLFTLSQTSHSVHSHLYILFKCSHHILVIRLA